MSSWVGQLLLENFCFGFCFCFVLFCFLLYNIVLVLPYINMNPPRVYTCSQSWILLPPPSPYHPSGSSQCTSPKHPVSCIEPRLVISHILMVLRKSVLSSFDPTHYPQLIDLTKANRVFLIDQSRKDAQFIPWLKTLLGKEWRQSEFYQKKAERAVIHNNRCFL